MERDAERAIRAWEAASDRKPLVLRGARQTGKTWLIQHLREHAEGDLANLNLERDPGLAACFATNDPRASLALLETRLRRSIVPGRTLLFIDEIQTAPAIFAQLRWFAEELPQLHVVAAGSLLDFALADHRFSMPVGRIAYGHLEPMTFSEFLLACGEQRLLDAIRASTAAAGLPAVLHQHALQLVRTYMLVGGMPAAVRMWVEKRSFVDVAELHRNLIQTMRDDFSKYAAEPHGRVDTARVATVFAAMPRLVGRKFMPSAVDREEKSAVLKHAYRLLHALARTLTPVRRTHASGIPLGADVDERYCKTCMLDARIVLHHVRDRRGRGGGTGRSRPGQCRSIGGGDFRSGQELRSCRPFNQEPELYTWVRESKYSNAEVDYVIQVGMRVVPIEVKSGASGRLRSLHAMVSEKGLDVGVRVCSEPLQLRDASTATQQGTAHSFRLLSVPFYMVSEIPRLVAEIPRSP